MAHAQTQYFQPKYNRLRRGSWGTPFGKESYSDYWHNQLDGDCMLSVHLLDEGHSCICPSSYDLEQGKPWKGKQTPGNGLKSSLTIQGICSCVGWVSRNYPPSGMSRYRGQQQQKVSLTRESSTGKG